MDPLTCKYCATQIARKSITGPAPTICKGEDCIRRRQKEYNQKKALLKVKGEGPKFHFRTPNRVHRAVSQYLDREQAPPQEPRVLDRPLTVLLFQDGWGKKMYPAEA